MTEDLTDEDNTNQEEDTVIWDAFEEARESDSTEDEIKMAMISAGATFKNVTRLFNGFMIDSGLAVSREERDDIIAGCMEDVTDLSEEADFDAMVTKVADSITGATEKSAATCIRNFCKKGKIEVFKKVGSGKSRQDGFRFKFYAALAANPAMTSTEAKALCDSAGSDNDKKAFSHYQAIRKLVNTVSGNAQEVDEAA